MCQPVEHVHKKPQDCLDTFFSYGICAAGENLCDWKEMNAKDTRSFRSRMEAGEVRARCLRQALPRGHVHVVVTMRDASPTMRVVDDVAWMGLTNSLVLLYRRADIGLSIAATGSSPVLAGFPCGITVQEKLLVPNKGNEAAVYLAYMLEYYEKLPSMTVFLHDHGYASWHSQMRPVFKRSRAYYLLMAARLRDPDRGELVHPEIQKLPSYPLLAGFIENAVTLNSCYCHFSMDLPMCSERFTLQDYEKATKRPIHPPSNPRVRQAANSLIQRSKPPPPPQRGRRLVWEESPVIFQQSAKLFGEIRQRFGRARDGGSTPFSSCCAMFIAQRRHIRRQPQQFYNASLSALLSTHLLSYHTGRWFEFNWFDLLFDPSASRDPLRNRRYVEIDDVYAEAYNEKNSFADFHVLIDS